MKTTTTTCHRDSYYPTTCHRDGTVTYWSVYRQQWERIDADLMSDETLATLTAAERTRVARHAARHAARA